MVRIASASQCHPQLPSDQHHRPAALPPSAVLPHAHTHTEECEHLKVKAAPRLARSDVADSVTGKQLVSNVRTSKGMFFTRNEDDIITRVEARVAAVTMLPPGHAESMQVLHYQSTEEYRPHHDYFSFEGRDANGGNRIATVLMYLTDVEAGGETVRLCVSV